MTQRWWSLDPPARWKAGGVGSDPIYFGCYQCDPLGRNGTLVAAVLSAVEPPAEPRHFLDVSIVSVERKDGSGRKDYHPAMLCAGCFEKVAAEHAREV